MGAHFVLALVLSSCLPPARARIAEVLYDAEGDDTGREFVELFNPGSAAVGLAGVRLEAGDGAGPGRWTARWSGGGTDSVPARGRFVIGGAQVVPPPDALATLDLQNGPDAVRLVWPDGAIEVVGYGTLADSEYWCGAPATDAPSGHSLARLPDDADLGSNALDFRPAVPSPGRANQPALDAALIRGSLMISPEQPAALEPLRISGSAANPGSTLLAPGALSIVCLAAAETLAATTLAAALAPAETARFTLDLPGLTAGRALLVVRAVAPGDERAENDADTLRVRVGPGPLEITEIQFHPRAGEGEWVEVRSRSGAPLDLADFTLSDRGVTRASASGGTVPLDPDSLAVLAQDRAALLARFPGLDAGRVVAFTPWAALNNTDDSTGRADAVVLRERDGAPCDRVDYSARGIPDGVPIERRAGGWSASTDPAGTPLRPPVELPVLSGRFEAAPRRLRAGAGPLRVGWSLPWPRAHIAIEVYDLAGRRVARLGAEQRVPGRGEREFSASALPPGVYRLVLRARAESGTESLVETRSLRVDGSAP